MERPETSSQGRPATRGSRYFACTHSTPSWSRWPGPSRQALDSAIVILNAAAQPLYGYPPRTGTRIALKGHSAQNRQNNQRSSLLRCTR